MVVPEGGVLVCRNDILMVLKMLVTLVSIHNGSGKPLDTPNCIWCSHAAVCDMLASHPNDQQFCQDQSLEKHQSQDRSDEEWILHFQFPINTAFPRHSPITLPCSLCLLSATWLIKFHSCVHTFFHAFSGSHTS